MDKLKLKRRIRDWFNKNVDDEETLMKVAKVIGYGKEIDHAALYSSIPVSGTGQIGHNCQG